MPIINTSELQPGQGDLQIYGGLDAALTFEVHEALQRLSNQEPSVYAFSRALQAPALEMMRRGFAIDGFARAEGIRMLELKLRHIDSRLQQMAFAVWGKSINPRSQKQLLEFFYIQLAIPEHWTNVKGQRKLSLNRETLEKLELYFHARPFVSAILSYRDTAKRLEVLRTEVDPDGRMRTSYNIAGTETGRWSSSASSAGTGTNLQNITPELRRMFVSDEGYWLVGIDLEQAESREVGWQCGVLFGDWTYLDACEGSDLHTAVCRLTWPALGWTGSGAEDRKIAERPYYRQLTYRDMAKKLGHGSNYGGSAFTLGRHAKIPTQMAQAFQDRYFAAFPALPRWHRYISRELQTKRQLTTPFGRTRQFFGRPTDDTTLREAIAFVPQSSTGDRMNLGLWRIWDKLGGQVQLLAQVHDAVYFQVPTTGCDLGAVITQALDLIDIPVGSGRQFTVPGEAKVGYNWGSFHPLNNPQGLKKWTGLDTRLRSSADPLQHVM